MLACVECRVTCVRVRVVVQWFIFWDRNIFIWLQKSSTSSLSVGVVMLWFSCRRCHFF